MARRRAALTADQVASGHQHLCAKLRVMVVIAIAEMFGISGRRAELATLLERFGMGWRRAGLPTLHLRRDLRIPAGSFW